MSICSVCEKPKKISRTLYRDIGICKDCVKLKGKIRHLVNDHLPQLEEPYYSNGVVHDKEIVALSEYIDGSETERNLCDSYIKERGYLPIRD